MVLSVPSLYTDFIFMSAPLNPPSSNAARMAASRYVPSDPMSPSICLAFAYTWSALRLTSLPVFFQIRASHRLHIEYAAQCGV